jgi:serine/threonine-protein kinase
MIPEPMASTIRSYGSPNPSSGGDGSGVSSAAPRSRVRPIGDRVLCTPRRTFWIALGALALILLAMTFGAEGGAGNIPVGAGGLVALAVVAGALRKRRRESSHVSPILDRYTLEEKIGEGAMGEVFRAHHELMGKPMAIKILRSISSKGAAQRFEREAQLTARLTHPNAISVFDYGRTRDGRSYYAMELLEGLTLDQLVARCGPLPAGRVIHLLLQACGALQEAHALGLVHRDIKPANMFVCSRASWYDVVKVLDFGLACELNRGMDCTHDHPDAIVGTPLYLSPEGVSMPSNVDARADIYALGAVAYFLLCGSPPFSAGSLWALCHHHVYSTPAPLSERRAEPLAPDLENIVLRCLAKDREQRPQTVLALAELLRNCRDAGTWGDAEATRFWRFPAALPPRISLAS